MNSAWCIQERQGNFCNRWRALLTDLHPCAKARCLPSVCQTTRPGCLRSVTDIGLRWCARNSGGSARIPSGSLVKGLLSFRHVGVLYISHTSCMALCTPHSSHVTPGPAGSLLLGGSFSSFSSASILRLVQGHSTQGGFTSKVKLGYARTNGMPYAHILYHPCDCPPTKTARTTVGRGTEMQ